MNGSQSYQSLVDKYKGSNQVVKKLGMSDLLIQLSIMGVIHAWRHVEIGYYHIAVPDLTPQDIEVSLIGIALILIP